MDSILFSVENGVAKITLNRPKVYNSFNREMALAMQARLDECVENSEIRASLHHRRRKSFLRRAGFAGSN